MGKTIGVVSLKGGVGKTTSVVALGHAFASLGKKVLLVDGNLSAPNLGMHLNILDEEKGLHNVINRNITPSEAIFELEDFDVMPSNIFDDSDFEHLSLKKRLGVLKNKYDVILIDSSPKLDEETLAVMLASDEIIVITSPDLPTLGTTMKSVKLAKKRGTPISGLVLNRVYNKKFEISLGEVEDFSEVPVMAVVPHDIGFMKALSDFKPYTKHKPNSEASQEYMKLAATLVGEKYKPVKVKSFFRWISPKKQDINRTVFYNSVFRVE